MKMQEGDRLYWEESNYMGSSLVKCIAKSVGKKFITVVNANNYEIKFNLETMQDTGRQYGRSHTGDIRYRLLIPTDALNSQYRKQVARARCANIASEINAFDMKQATDEKIAELDALLIPLREAIKVVKS